jgi:hypothetical protein
VAKWKSNGYRVYVEDDNYFKLNTFSGITGYLVGRPDLIAVKEADAIIVDVKGSVIKKFHKLQVLIYMWTLPQVDKDFANLNLAGRLVYPTGEQAISPDMLDEAFSNAIVKSLRMLLLFGDRDKTPSWSECRWCPIASSECSERIDRFPDSESYPDDSED